MMMNSGSNNKMMNSGSNSNKPHFVLVPLLCPGHLIPMVDVARLLAARHVHVSLVLTPVNAARVKSIVDRDEVAGFPIQLIELPFPSVEFSLPPGCENIDLVPSPALYLNHFEAERALQQPLLLRMRQLQPPPSCIISDSTSPWTRQVAEELRIPRVVFHGPSCFYLLCIHNIYKNKLNKLVDDELEPFLVPDMPHRVETARAKAVAFMDLPGWEKLFDDVEESDARADGFLINTFHELEAPYIERYEKAVGKKIWTIGPVSHRNKDVADKAERGNTTSMDKDRVMHWLDSKDEGSVIYVSFGSLSSHIPSRLYEIGHGLEASGKPFVWVIKEKERPPEVERWLREEFEERTRSMGLIIRGWAPQMMILSHPAVGGFMTHCGWNSTLEAVTAGVPMITWPHAFDQFMNEKLVVEVLGIGVGMGVKKPVTLFDESEDILITRDEVKKAVARLMDEEGGGERKRKAQELAHQAQMAMEEEEEGGGGGGGGGGGSSYNNLTHLIQYTVTLVEN